MLELCIRTTMDNLRYVDNVDGVEMDLLQRILPHCKMEDLTRIENNTEVISIRFGFRRRRYSRLSCSSRLV